MSTTSESAVTAWGDRLEVADAIYRYGSGLDSFDEGAVRAVLDDEITAQYGRNTDVLRGPDAVLEFIRGLTADCTWRHHFLTVYRADVDGDDATALVYHTSHQVFDSAPDTVRVTVGRYHNELRRTNGTWRIRKLYLEVLWAERRKDPSRYLEELGGPAVIWTRR